MLRRSYPYACGEPAQNERIRLYGISEREKQSDALQQFGDLKFKYRNREFWCRGCYVDREGAHNKLIINFLMLSKYKK